MLGLGGRGRGQNVKKSHLLKASSAGAESPEKNSASCPVGETLTCYKSMDSIHIFLLSSGFSFCRNIPREMN